MKEGIHPNYQQTTITCACGNVIETGSTKKDIKVEVCSKCHPFYTGKQKVVDTGGRQVLGVDVPIHFNLLLTCHRLTGDGENPS